MSAFKIGNQVGQAISDEMKRRGWKPEEVGALRITDYELPTARQRTDGATQSLLAIGFKKENIFDAPQKTTDLFMSNPRTPQNFPTCHPPPKPRFCSRKKTARRTRRVWWGTPMVMLLWGDRCKIRNPKPE